MTARPKSYEIIQDTILRDGEEVARNCGLSISLIRKWKEPNGDYTDSGAYNPLDRIVCIIETIKKIAPERAFLPLKWLAEHFGFVLVPLPQRQKGLKDVQTHLMGSIKRFGSLVDKSIDAVDDGIITKEEARDVTAAGYELQEEVAVYLDAIQRAVQ